MIKRKFRLVSAIITLAMLVHVIPVSAVWKEFKQGEYTKEEFQHGGYDAGYDPAYDCNTIDEQDVEYLINDNFTYTKGSNVYLEDDHVPSGWDVRTIGGSLNGTYWFSNWQLIDNSTKFPVEATRKFENITRGKGILQFVFSLENEMNGVCWELYQDNMVAVKLTTKDNSLYLEQRDGNLLEIAKIDVGAVYGVRIDFDVDNSMIDSLYVDGKLCAENVPFKNTVNYLNNFNINTGDEVVGTLSMRTVQLSRGYIVHEQFISTVGKNVIEDFVPQVSGGGVVSIGESEANTYPDNYYLKLTANNGNATAKKSFANDNDRVIVKYSVFTPEKTDDFEVNLMSGEKKAISFSSNSGSFSINGNPFYEYIKKVWYYVRFDIDFTNQTFDLYLNNKLKLTDVKFDANNLDSIVMQASNGAELWVDEIVIQKYIPEPEDYVPEPQPVSNPDIHLGMQFCPMWENGSHRGWDSINADKDRLPYLGYYDEGSPEVADWIIKQLLEHGISYMKIAWCGGANDDQAPHTAFMGGEFINGFLQAKYSHMMKFMILWENMAMGSSADKLVNVVGPYWIEHYFKDDRYLKIDGRPVLAWLSLDYYIEGCGNDYEVAKKGLEDFRQLCIDSGVGDPIYVFSATESDPAFYEKYKDLGIEVIQPYGAAPGATLSQDGFNNLLQEAVDEAGLTFSPTFGSGVDGRAWNSASMGYVPNEMFRQFLENYRDEFLKNADRSKPMWNYAVFDTYDEIGEGHYILPCGRTGWDLFDIIREVFVGEGEHEDIVPTMKQKDRFNNLYPYGRKVNTIESGETVGDIENLKVVKGWYFENDGDLEGWTNGGDIAGLKVADGCISGTASGRDPKIMINDLIDSEEATFLKIRIKMVGPSKWGQVFFATQAESGYSEAKSDFFRVYSDEFEDTYMCIGANASWDGFITSLRVDTLNLGMYDEPKDCSFYIDSIELLGEDKPKTEEIEDKDKEGFKICIGSDYIKPDAENILENEKAYFPLRQTFKVLGLDKIDYDAKKNEVNLLNGENYVKLQLNTGKVYYNDGEVLGENPYVVHDGTTYVDERLVTLIYGVDSEWDGEDTLVIKSGEEANALKRKAIFESDFTYDGDVEDWTAYKVNGFNAKDGMLVGSPDNENPVLWTPNDLDIEASDVVNISVAIKNDTIATTGKIYFVTDGSPNYDEDKTLHFNITPNDSSVTVYNIDPSVNPAWSGKIKQVRLDPASGATKGNFSIDYFRLESSEIEEVSGKDEISSHMTVTDSGVSWEFNTNGEPDGWEASKTFGNVYTQNGWLNLSVVGTNPCIVTNDGFSIDAKDVKKIKIKFKNNTNSKNARLYFTDDNAKGFEQEKSFNIEIYPNDWVGAVYEIETAANGLWDGEIKGLKFEPCNDKGSIAIDYIRLEK